MLAIIFWVYIIEQGNVVIVNKQLSYFRRHSNVVTTKSAANGTNFYILSIGAWVLFKQEDRDFILSVFKKTR